MGHILVKDHRRVQEGALPALLSAPGCREALEDHREQLTIDCWRPRGAPRRSRPVRVGYGGRWKRWRECQSRRQGLSLEKCSWIDHD